MTKTSPDDRVVFFHGGCTDGMMAALLFQRSKTHTTQDLRPYYHNRPVTTMNDMWEGKDVYFVDCCPPQYDIDNLLARGAKRVTILDHHVSSRHPDAIPECVITKGKVRVYYSEKLSAPSSLIFK
jgi:hypothetical protein